MTYASKVYAFEGFRPHKSGIELQGASGSSLASSTNYLRICGMELAGWDAKDYSPILLEQIIWVDKPQVCALAAPNSFKSWLRKQLVIEET